jgi:uncharacterized membrane protein YkoI
MVAGSVLAVALTAAAAGGAAAAGPDATNSGAAGDTQAAELQAIQNAKLTIADAAKAAETETGGKAVDVSIGDENGTVAYQVDVALKDGTMQEVRVDPQTGQVLKVSADARDQEGNDKGKGENGENDEHGEQSENSEN